MLTGSPHPVVEANNRPLLNVALGKQALPRPWDAALTNLLIHKLINYFEAKWAKLCFWGKEKNQLFKNYVSPAQRSARKDLQGRGSWGMAACLRGFWVTSSPSGMKVSFSPTDFEINFDQKNLQKQAGLAGWLVNQSPWGSDINGTFTCKYSKSQARWSMILWPPKQNDDPNRTNLPDPERPPCSLWLLRVWPVRHHNFGKIPPEPSFEKEKSKAI